MISEETHKVTLRLLESGLISQDDYFRYIGEQFLKEQGESKARTLMLRFDRWDMEESIEDLKVKWKIKRYAVDGKVAVYDWGRDCDMCESDRVTWIDATLEAYREFEQRVYDNAEGPVSCYPISPESAAEFEPSFRDRIAEAWDNGNTTPFSV